MKSYYEFHDQVYQSLKSKGFISWDKANSISEILDSKTKEFLSHVIQKHFPDIQGLKALDLGCGTGTSSFFLAKLGFEVTGIDISKTAIEMAETLAKQQELKIDFRVGDILNLGFLNKNFDLIYDSHCLHCIVFDEDRRKVLEQIKVSLSNNGIFVLDTMSFSENMNLTNESKFLRFDKDYILWHQEKDTSVRGVVQFENKSWCAQRVVKPADKIIEEVKACGYEVLSQTLDQQSDGEPHMLRMILKSN